MKKAAKKTAKKRPAARTKKLAVKIRVEKPIGVVTHYYSHLSVAIIKFSKPVVKGAKIRVRGATTDFEDVIESMQYDHKDIPKAPKGKEIGVKVRDKVRDGDEVFEA